jgi:hypothetical protein
MLHGGEKIQVRTTRQADRRWPSSRARPCELKNTQTREEEDVGQSHGTVLYCTAGTRRLQFVPWRYRRFRDQTTSIFDP